MNQNFSQLQQNFVLSGNQALVENIKILLYQTDENIFDKIDFEDDTIYREPLLFAYFKATKVTRNDLDIILYGYTKSELRPSIIKIMTDRFGRFYLPNIGWFTTNKPNEVYNLSTESNSIILRTEIEQIDYQFEPIELIDGTNIELLKYPIPLLEQFYYDVEQQSIDVEIENITQIHRKNLVLACDIIKAYVPNHFKIITLTTNRVVIFNVDTYLRNSFATLSAQGIGFFNAYQETYNEVFFLDDIAHQTGHIIFNAMIYEVEKFLRVNPTTILENVVVENVIVETRDIHVIFHALYTYYTTFICLDACLDANIFNSSKKHEMLGRMKFYIEKCYRDMSLIENPTFEHNKTEVFYNQHDIFTKDGLVIYSEIKHTFNVMADKWYKELNHFDLSNQPYNFTYSKFIELNPYK